MLLLSGCRERINTMLTLSIDFLKNLYVCFLLSKHELQFHSVHTTCVDGTHYRVQSVLNWKCDLTF